LENTVVGRLAGTNISAEYAASIIRGCICQNTWQHIYKYHVWKLFILHTMYKMTKKMKILTNTDNRQLDVESEPRCQLDAHVITGLIV
jgi:hypothetical protein